MTKGCKFSIIIIIIIIIKYLRESTSSEIEEVWMSIGMTATQIIYIYC
jgi:hypothetical protein